MSHVQANKELFFYKLHEFFLADKYTDVKILCQDRVFKCHRLVLATTCEYFDVMFSAGYKEKSLEEIRLHDIDCTTFEEVLRFAYQGDVVINDDNVYSLLCASDMLRLSFIENRCILYLRERNIPADHALEIFLFACATQKHSILSVVSRFIMQNLNRFYSHSEFLNIPLEELNMLLTFCHPPSSKYERVLLDAIIRWVSYSPHARDDKKGCFTQLTKSIDFRHFSTEAIAKHFDKEVVDCDQDTDIDTLHIWSPPGSGKLFLHVFANVKFGTFHQDDRRQDMMSLEKSRLCRFTLKKCTDVEMEWSPPRVHKPEIDLMRTVAVDDRLYCLQRVKGKLSFSVRSTIDFTGDTVSLRRHPFDSGYEKYHGISHVDSKIYVCRSNYFWSVFAYDCELDKWSVLIGVEEDVQAPCLTCCDNQVYLMGGFSDHKSRLARSSRRNRYIVRAYDERAGIWNELPDSKHHHSGKDHCCVHKGKIYVTCDTHFWCEPPVIEVYDPVAGKWDKIEFKTDNHTDDSHLSYQVERLVSYDNQLWIFGSTSNRVIIQRYDSFIQEWSASKSLDCAIKKTWTTKPTSDFTTFKSSTLEDVVVFTCS